MIGIVTRGDPEGGTQSPYERLHRIFAELRARGATAEAVVFTEETAEETRARLLEMDGVLVWVDPLVNGRDRSVLDQLLRDVAAAGVWVSAHPDVILKMGTKEVLVQTRDLEFGTETLVHRSPTEMLERLPELLRRGPRVLKQLRGNGGNGVWRIRLLGDAPQPEDTQVEVLHAIRAASLEDLRLGDFVQRCGEYFERNGCVIDQPYQERLGEGMIRCYVTQNRVAGFGHQYVTALLPPSAGTRQSPPPPPRLYYGPDKPEFQALRARMEERWIADLQRVLEIETDALPAVWDVDFLLGPKAPGGDDTYVLCEINVSSVFPIPNEAVAPLADAAIAASERARVRR